MSRLARLSTTLAAAALALGLAARPMLAHERASPATQAAAMDRVLTGALQGSLPSVLNGLSLDGIVPAPDTVLDPQDGLPGAHADLPSR